MKLINLIKIIVLSIIIITASKANIAYAERTLPIKTEVDKGYNFTVKFNKEIDPNSIKGNIYVFDSNGSRPDINMTVGDDNMSIDILAPNGGYRPGETYTITVNNSVMTKDYKGLKEVTKMQFTVRKDTTTIDDIVKKGNTVVYVEGIDEYNQTFSGGSGFIFYDRVVTSYNLIDKALGATITLTDGTKLFASGVYAYDKEKNIAVLKVYGYNLPTVSLANSDKININDKLVAIEGNKAEENTVTTGTIQEFNKNVFTDGIKVSGCPQLWQGGGPLFNMNGDVVGMTLSGIINNNSYTNYAVSINKLKEYLSTYTLRTFQQVKDEMYPFILPDGGIYSGIIIDDKANGYGTSTYPNDNMYDKYIGNFKDNLMDGIGTMYYKNGDIYVGEFKEGKMDGKGTLTWYNGRYKYIGEFKDGLRNGQGTLYYDGAIVYVDGVPLNGVWKDGHYIGQKPNAPTGVKAKAVSSDSVQVGWNEVSDADYYYVYYSDNYFGEYNCIKNSDGTNKKFYWLSEYSCAQFNLQSKSTYYYKVTSVKNGVESDFSNLVNVTTMEN